MSLFLKHYLKISLFTALCTFFSAFAQSEKEAKPIKIVTTTTDLAWAAQQILGPRGTAESLLTGSEDPHFVDARPDFIFKVTKADLVCIVGLELEIGWIPKVLTKSGNAKVQMGGPGFCDFSKTITPLEKPTGAVDRSMGDVHPSGNPHYWLSPSVFAAASTELTSLLSKMFPQFAEEFNVRSKKLTEELQNLEDRLKRKLQGAYKQGLSPKFYEYHKDFSYWALAYGFESLGSLEEKPGISPNAGRLAQVALSAKASGAKVILATVHAPRRDLTKFEEISGLKVIAVPVSIQPKRQDFESYAKIQEHIVDEILKLN